MSVSTRVEPINRDIELMISEELSPQAQSKQFAEFAGEAIEEAKQLDATILGRVPRYTVSVDGRLGAPLESVKPDGVIIVEFELFDDVLKWIADQLITHSPVKTGRYQKSHTLFADGTEVDVGAVVPQADEYVFINDLPYTRKIERGSSSQAPDGVYQAVATLASGRFGNVAHISFTFRPLIGGRIGAWAATTRMSSKGHASGAAARAEWLMRQPAIIVRVSRDSR